MVGNTYERTIPTKSAAVALQIWSSIHSLLRFHFHKYTLVFIHLLFIFQFLTHQLVELQVCRRCIKASHVISGILFAGVEAVIVIYNVGGQIYLGLNCYIGRFWIDLDTDRRRCRLHSCQKQRRKQRLADSTHVRRFGPFYFFVELVETCVSVLQSAYVGRICQCRYTLHFFQL